MSHGSGTSATAEPLVVLLRCTCISIVLHSVGMMYSICVVSAVKHEAACLDWNLVIWTFRYMSIYVTCQCVVSWYVIINIVSVCSLREREKCIMMLFLYKYVMFSVMLLYINCVSQNWFYHSVIQLFTFSYLMILFCLLQYSSIISNKVWIINHLLDLLLCHIHCVHEKTVP